jgi:hypothetical protein
VNWYAWSDQYSNDSQICYNEEGEAAIMSASGLNKRQRLANGKEKLIIGHSKSTPV